MKNNINFNEIKTDENNEIIKEQFGKEKKRLIIFTISFIIIGMLIGILGGIFYFKNNTILWGIILGSSAGILNFFQLLRLTLKKDISNLFLTGGLILRTVLIILIFVLAIYYPKIFNIWGVLYGYGLYFISLYIFKLIPATKNPSTKEVENNFKI